MLTYVCTEWISWQCVHIIAANLSDLNLTTVTTVASPAEEPELMTRAAWLFIWIAMFVAFFVAVFRGKFLLAYGLLNSVHFKK